MKIHRLWKTLKRASETSYPVKRKFKYLIEQLNDLSLEELGIDGEDDPYFFRPEKEGEDKHYFPKISATHIVETDDYAILMFFMKKGAGLPLHDHDGMHLYTRVLTGQIKYRAMDKMSTKFPKANPLRTFMLY